MTPIFRYPFTPFRRFTVSPVPRIPDSPSHRFTNSPFRRFTVSPIRFQKGFTLLEVMIAVILLTVALLALLRVMPMGLKASKLGEDLTTATLLAQRRLEEIKREGYASIPDESSESIAPGHYSRYEWQVISSSAASDLKQVTVSVWWPAQEGSDHSGQRCAWLTTLMANYSSD